MRYLHCPWHVPPTGANVGISCNLFKMLWPDSTVVSLEPDSGNFGGLKRNTQTCVCGGAAPIWQRKVLGSCSVMAAQANVPGPARLHFRRLPPGPTLEPLPPAACRLENVHLVNAGLWGWKTHIKAIFGETDDAWASLGAGVLPCWCYRTGSGLVEEG